MKIQIKTSISFCVEIYVHLPSLVAKLLIQLIVTSSHLLHQNQYIPVIVNLRGENPAYNTYIYIYISFHYIIFDFLNK